MSTRLSDLFPGHVLETGHYEDDGWDAFCRDHTGGLNKLRSASLKEVKKDEAWRFRGDFFGYLRFLGYSNETDWINLTLNGYEHPTEFQERSMPLNLISDETLSQWYIQYHNHLGEN